MADLPALRAIVGPDPSDDELCLLLRDSTVETAANRFFDGALATGAQTTSTSSNEPANAKRVAAIPPAPPGRKLQRTEGSGPSTTTAMIKPLAERLRPRSLDQLLGQGEALDAILRQALANDRLPSLILWGPPGCGKTSFASCVAASTQRIMRNLSAAKSGVAELRDELTRAANAQRLRGVGTILFVDELHRWSKAQQDALLMDVEKGTVTLIGATTENPSFSINNAILSRCRLVLFQKVPPDALSKVLDRALEDDAALTGVRLTPAARSALVAAADGDARVALNTLELAASAMDPPGHGQGGDVREVDGAAVLAAMQRRATYDRNGDFHYDLISALHKSLRGGDPDGALYYCCRMLAGGEDPRYLTRRLIRFASEDIGLADPHALQQAVAADQATHAIGMPECGVCIGQCAVYLALAPKSVAVYRAYAAAMKAAKEEAQAPVPLHLRNAPTKMMKEIGYGKGYEYNPGKDYARGCPEGYLPQELGPVKFFEPKDCEKPFSLKFCGGASDAKGP